MASTTSLRALWIGRDESYRSELQQTLGKASIDLIEAGSRDGAIEVCKTLAPQIILTDLDLPGLPQDLIKTLAENNPHALIATISSQSGVKRLAESIHTGASDFIVKPFTQAELQAFISRLTSAYRRRNNALIRPELIEQVTFEFKIPSVSAALSPVLSNIVDLLGGFLSEKDVRRVELGLDEVIRNAYEHGNLGVTFEEKRNLCDEGRFEQVLAERSLKACAEGKFITVTVKLDKQCFSCTVADQGKGFDWKKSKALKIGEGETDPNGRGIFLINRVFDEVSYNEVGNQVTLRKKF